MPSAIMECGDFSEFQEALKNMRRVDDLIVNTLNSIIPTDSFHPDGKKTCKDFHNQMKEQNSKRINTIKNCLNLTTERVRKLKEQRENINQDKNLSKALRTEQTKLRMLQVELTVEDLIQQRTAKVFQEKCRNYFKPI